MTKNKKRFSEITRCGHCGNKAPMEVGASFSQVQEHEEPQTGEPWGEGYIHDLLVCPACRGLVLQRCYWHEFTEPEGLQLEVVYPVSVDVPRGLPKPIEQEYEAALKVRSASPNAYGVLLGRLLELVCEDRRAKGSTLSTKLRDLAAKGELPAPLVDVAESLAQLRNVGAHASLGRLTSGEVPVLEKLCRAILEYVYAAPHLVKEAQDRLSWLREGQRRKKKQGPKKRAESKEG